MSNAANTVDESQLDEVPPRWRSTTLGQLGEYINGRGFKKAEWSEKGLPIIRIQNLTGTGKEQNYYDGEIDERHIVNPGDLLISWAATLGAYFWTGPRAALNQHIFKVRSFVDKKFHYYLMQHILADLYRQTHGSGMVHITKSKFDTMPVLVPETVEHQVRIVTEIEKQFSRLDEAIANLNRVKANLKRYKAAVLKAAVEGRLVETEAELARRENRDYETGALLTRRLLESRARAWHGHGKYREPAPPKTNARANIPEGWADCTLEQLTPPNRPAAYGVLQPGDDVASGVPFVRVGDISEGHVALDAMKRISPAVSARYPRTQLEGGEVLITLVGAIGRTALAPAALSGANVARAVAVIPITHDTDARWVELWLRSPAQLLKMNQAAHEVARKTLNLEDVRRITVLLPPLCEQQRIVAAVDRLISVADAQERAIDETLERTRRLRTAILANAFRASTE